MVDGITESWIDYGKFRLAWSAYLGGGAQDPVSVIAGDIEVRTPELEQSNILSWVLEGWTLWEIVDLEDREMFRVQWKSVSQVTAEDLVKVRVLLGAAREHHLCAVENLDQRLVPYQFEIGG